MPTGYTYQLCEEEISFEKFACNCARAFGACITLIDEPLSTPIPEKFEPDDYYLKEIKGSKKELKKLSSFDDDKKIKWGKNKQKKDIEQNEKYLNKIKEQNQRLKNMIKQVKEWIPPSKDHEHFKEFMIKQLEISIDDPIYTKEQITNIKTMKPLDLFNEKVQKLKDDIIYNEKHYKEECDRINERNLWIKQLRDSLNSVTA